MSNPEKKDISLVIIQVCLLVMSCIVSFSIGQHVENNKFMHRFCEEHCNSIQMYDHEIVDERCWCIAEETKHLVDTKLDKLLDDKEE